LSVLFHKSAAWMLKHNSVV